MSISQFDIADVWKIYYYIALFSTILFVLKLGIFMLFGGDAEVHADFTTETDSDCSFDFISVQSVIAFFMGFGWMGYAGLQQLGLGQIRNFLVAFAVGVIFLLVTSMLMFSVKKLEKNVTKDKKSAIGKVGRAYTTFAPNSNGQIEIEINGQLSVVNAMNDSEAHINAFDMVKVLRVVNDVLYIESLKNSNNG